MCDFCKDATKWSGDPYDDCLSDRSLHDGLMVSGDGTYQMLTFRDSYDFWDCMDVNYCPICGRKLVEE